MSLPVFNYLSCKTLLDKLYIANSNEYCSTIYVPRTEKFGKQRSKLFNYLLYKDLSDEKIDSRNFDSVIRAYIKKVEDMDFFRVRSSLKKIKKGEDSMPPLNATRVALEDSKSLNSAKFKPSTGRKLSIPYVLTLLLLLITTIF